MYAKGRLGSVYLAGRYDRREELQHVAALLTAIGFEVTSRWLTEEHDMDNVDDETRAAYALDDMLDVLRADFCFSVTEERSVGYNKGGRHAEFGMAMAAGKKCCIVGEKEHVFHYLPNVTQFKDWPSLLAYFGVVLVGGNA